MKYKIVIKRNLCQSAATCVAMAPDIYKLDDEFKAVLTSDEHSQEGDDWTYELDADEKRLKQIITGAEACPYNAIEVYNDKGKKIYPKQ